MAMAASYSANLIQDRRERLAQHIFSNNDVSEYIEELINVDVPLTAKFREVNFCDVLSRNSESVDSLKKLIIGLKILEKYCRHLLKPAESRSYMWRYIKYNNAIYSNRVDILQGGRDIMAIMGYSENLADCVAFPEDAEPNQQKILNLVVDIILGKKELETYLNGNHPHPHFIEAYIGEDVVTKLRSKPYEKPPESVQALSNTGTEQNQPTELQFQPVELPALSLMETISMPQKKESLPGLNQPGSQPGFQPGSQPGFQPGSQPGFHPGSQPGSQPGFHPIQQASDAVPQQPVLKLDLPSAQSGEKGTDVKANIDNSNPDIPLESETPPPSIACDICGDNRAHVICRQCDSKQLCKGCDIKWHKHPKRQNHQVDLLRPNEDISVAPSQEPSNKAGASHDPAGVSHDRVETIPAPPEMFQQQKAWIPHQQQQQQGYLEPEQQQQARQMFDRSQNFQEYPGNTISGYHTMSSHAQQPYFVPTHPYNYQYGQLREGFPQKEGTTLMYDPVSGQQYEVPSMQHGRSLQPASQQHLNTFHDPSMADNRQASVFGQRQQPIPTSHMMTTGQSNFPQQRYLQTGTPYPPLSSTGLPVGTGSNVMSSTNPHMMPYLHNTSQGVGLGHQGGTSQGQYTPPTPSNMSTPSPCTPLVSPISNLSDEKNFVSSNQPYRSIISSQVAPGSRLLPKIKAIPDLEKRRSRLEIDLMNLKEDIVEWDKKINEIIYNFPNFFQNEEYLTLNKKKRKHLHEITELETYQKDLEVAITDMMEQATQVKELEALRKLAMQKKQEVKKQDQGPPGSPALHPPQTAPDVKGSTGLPTAPHTEPPGRSTYQPVLDTSKDQYTEDPPGLMLSSLEMSENESTGGIPEDVRRMLVLDQSPFENPIKPKEPVSQMNVPVEPNINRPHMFMNVPVEPPIGNRHDVTYPPVISAVNNMNKDLNTLVPVQNTVIGSQNAPGPIPSGRSAPDLQHFQRAVPPARSRSTSAGYQWECEHCTFINGPTVKACTMCFKTSDNPKILTPSFDEQPSEGDDVHCANCTFLNKKGYKQCEMCGEAPKKMKIKQPLPAQSDEIGVIVQKMSELGKSKMAELSQSNLNDPGASKPKEEIREVESRQEVAPNMTNQPRGLDAIIKEDQDQIYWEKKAAQDKFDKMNRNENWSSSSSGQSTVVENNTGANLMSIAGKLDSSEKKGSSDATENTSSYETAKTSLNTPQEIPEQVAQAKPDLGSGAVHKGFKGASDFTKTIEQIQLKRDQEQMSLDAYELMSCIKLAEKSDFEMEEITIALQNCTQDEMKPLVWLKEKWTPMIDMVEEMSAEKEKSMSLKDIGDISREEARESLLHCKGDVDQAVMKCIEERRAKFQKIVKSGHYSHEDILTALLQNRGDVDEALDQLNQSAIQAYIDRLWGVENNQRGRQSMFEGAVASRRDDLNRVCNSVVNDDGFLAVIRDMDTDRDRRIRMVFVEGKLVSWGRADIVIQILEQNILQTDDPLDCTLEDIIDAVRNCGDRRSSLVYLKEECGTCMGLYPMSKIRNLGVCTCKLCESCLKQCFEIAVREKFVRNWGCPICDAPGLGNDETQASDYFDFLHLLLEQLVSKELLDLYDIKLRDWHLQKDPNFRWCAHCAFGFIWDRPDVLGMTCPTCQQKTCFSCKILWEDQHQGLNCEEFAQWKIDNDPEKQAKGVKLYLEENGIDCPSCKMRYSLAKGGCMHFRCPQCGHEFCSGCSQAFLQQGVCKLLNSCRNKGLHCHHPRDCFYYLRDNEVVDLQRLLKKHHIEYNTETPPTQADKQHCAVMEQKEFGAQKKDEACNKDIQKGQAGLCESHFKEYLVGLINKSKIDPITIMKLKDIKILIERNEKVIPELKQNENEAPYRNRLIQFVKERFRLQR